MGQYTQYTHLYYTPNFIIPCQGSIYPIYSPLLYPKLYHTLPRVIILNILTSTIPQTLLYLVKGQYTHYTHLYYTPNFITPSHGSIYSIYSPLSLYSPAAKEAFASCDKRDEGKIKVGEIAAAMKRLGHNIKVDWLEKMEDEIDTEGASNI